MSLNEQRTLNLSGTILAEGTGESLGFMSISMNLDYSNINFTINLNGNQTQRDYSGTIQQDIIDFLNSAFAQGRNMGWECLDLILSPNQQAKEGN